MIIMTMNVVHIAMLQDGVLIQCVTQRQDRADVNQVRDIFIIHVVI